MAFTGREGPIVCSDDQRSWVPCSFPASWKIGTKSRSQTKYDQNGVAFDVACTGAHVTLRHRERRLLDDLILGKYAGSLNRHEHV